MIFYYRFYFFLAAIFCAIFCLGIENPRCSHEPVPKWRVAIGFFGLSRSLKNTLPTIERHVFEVLERSNISFDVFWSTLDADHITNKRSGENNVSLDSTDFLLMRPCVLSIVSQSVVAPHELDLFLKARAGLPASITDPWSDGMNSVRNVLGAYHSSRTLEHLIKRYSTIHNITYNAVIVLRPDTAVVNDIEIVDHIAEIVNEDANFVAAVGNSSSSSSSYPQPIWIPDFHNWMGYNDRAAYGSMRVMSLYLTRGALFRDYIGVGRKSFGEAYLKHYLDHFHVVRRLSPLRVVRVRADNVVANMDISAEHMNMDNAAFAAMAARCFVHRGEHMYLNGKEC